MPDRKSRPRPMNARDLWALPRVGEPEPSPDGSRFVVPVTRYSMDTNGSETRLWLVPADARRAGNGRRDDPAIPLTAQDAKAAAPAWSPDGTRIAFTRKPGGAPGDAGAPAEGSGPTKPGPRHPDEAQLYVLRLEGGEPERLTDLPWGVAFPRWFPDGRRIAFFSRVYESITAPEKVAERKKERAASPVSAHATDRRLFRYWDQWLTYERVFHLFVLDTETGDLVDLTPKLNQIPEVSDWLEIDVAPDGKEIAFGGLRKPTDDLRTGIFTVKVPARLAGKPKLSPPKEITPDFCIHASRPVYSPDGRWILYGVQREEHFYADRVRLAVWDRENRRHTLLTEDWDFSAAHWCFAPDGRTVFLSAEVAARTAIWRLDLRSAVRSPRAHPPVEVVRGGTFSAPRLAGGRILANLSSIDRPPEIVSVGHDGRGLVRTTAFCEPGLAGIQISEHEEVYFEGAEGDKVHMMIVYPPGVKKPPRGGRPRRRLPLVHMIHGGPHGTFGDQWHWRWCAQVFAAPGYVCALVNFHGSTSWGQDFTASILGRWGDQPYVDIMRATDYLIERGIADPKRMAVSGGSYGGYLVSWIASQTNRFSCIMNHAGVSDVQTQYASDVTHGRRRAIGGEAWDDLEGLDRYNPMRHARGFKTPMLVIHGQKDYRVPYANGIEIYNVYKAMGKTARLVIYPDENHWILSPRNSEHWYGEVLGWFRRYLGGREL